MDPRAFLENGTARHYFKVNALLQDVKCVNDRVSVTLLNRESILSTHWVYVLISGLTALAQRAEILPGLTMSSLLSVSQLCDNGCTIVFNKAHATVSKHSKVIFQATRNNLNNMYKVNIQNCEEPQTVKRIHNLYHLAKIKDVLKYLHQCCFLPPIATWCGTIDNNFFQSWPHLTSMLVQNTFHYCPTLCWAINIGRDKKYDQQNLHSKQKKNIGHGSARRVH